MNWKFVAANIYRFLFLFVSFTIVASLAQYFLYTPERTLVMMQWCLGMGILFGALESAFVYLLSIKFIPVKVEETE